MVSMFLIFLTETLQVKKNIFDIGSKKYLFNLILENIENFKPEMILFGHVDRINYINFFELKKNIRKLSLHNGF